MVGRETGRSNVRSRRGLPIPDDPDALMDAIIALDDLYQAGDLPEQAYRERREAMKARLKEVLGS